MKGHVRGACGTASLATRRYRVRENLAEDRPQTVATRHSHCDGQAQMRGRPVSNGVVCPFDVAPADSRTRPTPRDMHAFRITLLGVRSTGRHGARRRRRGHPPRDRHALATENIARNPTAGSCSARSAANMLEVVVLATAEGNHWRSHAMRMRLPTNDCCAMSDPSTATPASGQAPRTHIERSADERTRLRR